MQAPVQRLLSRPPLPARWEPARVGKGTQLAAHLSGWGEKVSSFRPPSRLDRETCVDGMAVTTDTRPPTAREWIGATTRRRAARYLLVPAALCTHGLGASHLWSHVPYLAQRSTAKAASLPRGLQAVTPGYWYSTAHGHTHTPQHPRHGRRARHRLQSSDRRDRTEHRAHRGHSCRQHCTV